MSLEIMRDPRVRSVQWRDLVDLHPLEVVKEVLISAPFLALSLYLAQLGFVRHWAWFIPALAVSYIFFLTGLRQVHNAFHYVIGIPRWATEWLMFVLSVVMTGSMHAVQINHLEHHKHCMDDEDVEAMSARMNWLQALTLGPRFPYMLHRRAYEIGKPRLRRWVTFELLANAVWIALVFGVFDLDILKYHVITMAVGQCFTGFFAVWTVHHHCDRSHYIARTLRSTIKRLISFNMFFHLEHHLYPAVPTCHLHQLAERLDLAAPELQSKRVF